MSPAQTHGRRRSVAFVAVALIAAVSCGSNTGTATVINKADEPIARAAVTMSWGETLEVAGLNPGDTATLTYRVREGDYRVEVVFRSGKRLESEGMYVTTGVDYEDQIVVTSLEIQVSHLPVRTSQSQN